MRIGYLSGGQGALEHLKEQKEKANGIDEKERRRRRRQKVPEGLGSGGPEALDIRFDPSRIAPAEIDARLAKLARECTERDVKWVYPKGIETRVDLGEGGSLSARPLNREFGPDAGGTVRFGLTGGTEREIRLKILPCEGIDPSETGIAVLRDVPSDLSLRVTGKVERFARIMVEVRLREDRPALAFPVFLAVGEKTLPEGKGTFELHPSETDPNWSLFGK